MPSAGAVGCGKPATLLALPWARKADKKRARTIFFSICIAFDGDIFAKVSHSDYPCKSFLRDEERIYHNFAVAPSYIVY